ncbi:hypothetical protein LY78DRAFT_655492 [Colletotrichum sublineola]|nr:hypothetical protein LY78DRAFT_655492 [Colletotrichum sublineola]
MEGLLSVSGSGYIFVVPVTVITRPISKRSERSVDNKVDRWLVYLVDSRVSLADRRNTRKEARSAPKTLASKTNE